MSTYLLPVLVELGRHAVRPALLALFVLLALFAVSCGDESPEIVVIPAPSVCVVTVHQDNAPDAGELDAGNPCDPESECFDCATGDCLPASQSPAVPSPCATGGAFCE